MALHRSGVIAGVVVVAAVLASCKDDATPRLEPFIDESRLRMDVDAKFGGGTLTMRGVYIIKPT